eukprot:CAMPEP_0206198766 /NCGR_PEP_ID=MMETSP0166-20121206/9836_1 /ASSEMBLY_ACC=CAM_ASM_000260 /TAXON_ID=95228 /ORGANISM="Vannella robusta, Strain DIVA3 518/3/11/1/6" /LENGTH=181 /DNA_ID=CAMNT_0053616689 /DNA_START=155 /DNA_END=700 /DNA_ORIENTATION=+
MNSFVRQLHTYGFKKITKKDSKDLEFKHKLFIKGQEKLLPFITRRGPSNTSVKQQEEENYSIIKKSVEEQDLFMKQLQLDNENMTKELLAARNHQTKTEQELYKVKRELLEARALLRQIPTQFPSYYPFTNNMTSVPIHTPCFEPWVQQRTNSQVPATETTKQNADDISYLEDMLQLDGFE